MTDDARSRLGRLGEDAATAVYTARGYGVVARNWRCEMGEIDLVLTRGSVLVICEVKTRRGRGLGGPFDAVTLAKQRRLRALAAAFLQSRPRETAQAERDVRFDVASVCLAEAGVPDVHVFEDAF